MSLMKLMLIRIFIKLISLQVQARHPYVGQQPDELSLEVCDVVNVLKKMVDGKSMLIRFNA